MTAVDTQPSVTVGDVERQTSTGFNQAVPFVFVGLLVFGVMIGAQTLLTSTVEEKSSRVVEVLLSAVSPLELMAGKILGQMAVSLLVLALYVGIGVLMLSSFAMLGLLDPWLIVYLVIFFLITYFMFASVFGAIGAAVNEMREAQALVTPVMLMLMVPWLLAAPVARDPNSTFAMALSFIPPVNTLAMMIRMSSTTPPPMWEVWLSIAVGLAAACAATWVAAKISHRAADVRQAAELRDARPLGAAVVREGPLSRAGRSLRRPSLSDTVAMNVWVGTSGYNYPEWKGSFYPETLPAAKMLPYYAERFPTVEINYTFYRAPTEKILTGWSAATPERFKLTLKAPEADHARRAAARLRRSGAPVPRDGRGARAEARSAPLSAAAQSQEGSGALRRVPRDLSAQGVRGVRVPPSVVVRRRGVRAAARSWTWRCASPTARSSRRRSRSRRRMRISGCATRATRRRTSNAGPAW